MRKLLLILALSVCCVRISSAAPPRKPTQPPPTWFSTLPADKRAAMYWSADTETGNISQYEAGAPWASGNASWKVVTGPVHSGKYALSSTINTSRGQSGVRWPMRSVPGFDILPDTAFYSVWALAPKAFDAAWFNLMQWKTTWADYTSSDPTWSVNLVGTTKKQFQFNLYSYVGDDGKYNTAGVGIKASSSMTVKPGEWFHLETYYEWSTSNTGNIEVYLNGSKIMEQHNVVTQFLRESLPYKPRQWTFNAYGDKLSPNPITMYFDDAAISRVRLGSTPLTRGAVPEPTSLLLMGVGVPAVILTRASRRVRA